MALSISNRWNLRTTNFKANDVADALDETLSVVHGGTTGGTATAYTATPSPAWTSYASKDIITIVPHTNNTGATTLNVSGLGVKTVQYLAKACVGGELVSGVPAFLYYDGTNFQLLNHGGGWASWTPTYGASGGTMSWAATPTTNVACYQRHGDEVRFLVNVTGTLNGTAGDKLTYTVPINATASQGCHAVFINNSGLIAGTSVYDSATTFAVRRYDAGNFTAGGTSCTFTVSGIYRV